MTKLDAHERLRRAASLLTHEEDTHDRTRLLQAWEMLRGVRTDEFPAELRPSFDFLRREMVRAEEEDVSARDVAFLSNKLRQLELMWVETPGTTLAE